MIEQILKHLGLQAQPQPQSRGWHCALHCASGDERARHEALAGGAGLGLVLFLMFGRSLLLGPDRDAILDARVQVAHAVRAAAPRPREGLLS